MINIRYHVYSLVAVFLALAIGVAAGSTVVQRSVVDNLKSTQSRIEQNLDGLEARNRELEDRTAALEQRAASLVDEGPGALLAGVLDGTPLVVVRAEGVSGDSLGDIRRTLAAAGAEVVSDIEIKVEAGNPDELSAFAEQLGLPEDQRAPEDVQQVLGERLGTQLAAVGEAEERRTESPQTTNPDEPGVTGTAPETTEAPPPAAVVSLSDYLHELDDAGLASVRGFPVDAADAAYDELAVVIVGGLTTELDAAPVLRPMLDAVAEAGRPVALAVDAGLDQPAGDEETVYGIVPTVRGDGRLEDNVATVDNVSDFAGLSAIVLGLAALQDGQVGHYGVEEGRDSLLPAGRP